MLSIFRLICEDIQAKSLGIKLVPKPGYAITCDVFIYNNKCYAYNFTNFYVENNLNTESKIAIIAAVIFSFAISAADCVAVPNPFTNSGN